MLPVSYTTTQQYSKQTCSRCYGCRCQCHTFSDDTILVCNGTVVDVRWIQVPRVHVKPARAHVEIEIDRHALCNADAVTLTRRYCSVLVVFNAVYRVTISQFRPLWRAFYKQTQTAFNSVQVKIREVSPEGIRVTMEESICERDEF